jgi:hypothetical protein
VHSIGHKLSDIELEDRHQCKRMKVAAVRRASTVTERTDRLVVPHRDQATDSESTTTGQP